MASTVYGYPRFGGVDLFAFRVPGTGLGNLLFPWARFVVGTRRWNLRPIAPTWMQMSIGPWLRREPDKRIYATLFRRPHDAVWGPRKGWLLARLPRISEYDFDGRTLAQATIVEFKGMKDYFADFVTEHRAISAALLEITRPAHRRGMVVDFGGHLAVHVRLGDFALPSTAELRRGQANVRQPISWYVEAVQMIRAEMGRTVPVVLYSDGRLDELRPLLALPAVQRISFGSSVADLLALSRAPALIASASTFSMWASWLGQMPTLWHQGQRRQCLQPEDPAREMEWEPGQRLPGSAFSCLASALDA